MSAPGSVYDAKKPPSKDDYELDDLPEVTQGTVTPVGIPPRGDPEYEAKLAQLGLGERQQVVLTRYQEPGLTRSGSTEFICRP
jgi:hypothetical protein